MMTFLIITALIILAPAIIYGSLVAIYTIGILFLLFVYSIIMTFKLSLYMVGLAWAKLIKKKPKDDTLGSEMEHIINWIEKGKKN